MHLYTEANFKKRTNGLRFTRRPTAKYGNYSSNKFYRRNNAKIKNLWQKVQITARLNYEPIRSVVNLSNQTFTKDFSNF